MLLEVRDATVTFGKVRAIRNISLQVEEAKVVTIIGGNGAGKSTSLRAISGLTTLSSGSIHFQGEQIDHLPAHLIVSKGIVHVPEGRRVFPELTVEENLKTGAYLRHDNRSVARDLRSIYEQFPRLDERRRKYARTLSGGEQQMLAIGRGLMAKPRLLLMDEPSMGLAPVVVEEIARIIEHIARLGVPVVLVEQNANLALSLADYAYVLETGRIVLEGEADALQNNEHVRAAYLGI